MRVWVWLVVRGISWWEKKKRKKKEKRRKREKKNVVERKEGAGQNETRMHIVVAVHPLTCAGHLGVLLYVCVYVCVMGSILICSWRFYVPDAGSHLGIDVSNAFCLFGIGVFLLPSISLFPFPFVFLVWFVVRWRNGMRCQDYDLRTHWFCSGFCT